MATEVDICNLAIGALGITPITTLDDATQNARTCKLFYSLMRDSYLSEHDWSFATKAAELTVIDPTPAGYGDFQYAYEYPADCLKARIVKAEDTKYPYTFLIKDSAGATIILTNLQDAWLEYTEAITDTLLFSPIFIDALSSKLAFKISWPLTKDLKIQKQAFDQFTMIDQMVKQNDSSSQLPVRTPISWEQARSSCSPQDYYTVIL